MSVLGRFGSSFSGLPAMNSKPKHPGAKPGTNGSKGTEIADPRDYGPTKCALPSGSDSL